MSEETNKNNDKLNDNNNNNNNNANNQQQPSIEFNKQTPQATKLPSSHHINAHLVTASASGGLSAGNSGMQSPTVEKIVEEEEEEAEEECAKEQITKPSPITNTSNNQQQPSSQPHTSKFILEPVILENKPPVATTASLTPVTPATSSTNHVKKLEASNKSLKTNDNSTNNDNYAEATEIRVEEGYATRQMDEYFRQTIAAIKEELTKKLENKSDDPASYNQQNISGGNKTLNYSDFDSGSDYEDDNLNNDDYEHNYHPNESSHQGGQTNEHFYHRNLLYQHLLMFNKKKPNKSQRLNSWLVMFGCFLNHFIIDGLCYNYANLFDMIQVEFDTKQYKRTSKLIASIPGAFLVGFFLLIAPISLFLTKQYGTRRIAIIGSFISSISLLISSFLKENIITFTLFYGFFTGIGIGLIYVPSVIATSKWFLKKRLFANSVNVLGACLGASLYPILSDYILKKYELFDTLFILSGVQLNCFIGSLLLRERQTPFSSRFNTNNLNANSMASRPTNTDDISHVNEIRTQANNKKFASNNGSALGNGSGGRGNYRNNLINKNFLIGKGGVEKNNLVDSETESTTSVSTATVTNYTLKQYWRKFVQTRKTQANTKKNLFHLIAEEKRKTRTLSKTSLEDGFVITTSNNLLAPNDESHVIITRQEKLAALHMNQTASTANNNSTSSNAASRFFTRIANSLRSLAHLPSHNTNSTNSPINTTNHSKSHLASNTLQQTQNNQLYDINEGSNNNTITSKSNHNENTTSTTTTTSTTGNGLIPLMSVFNNPLNNSSEPQDDLIQETNLFSITANNSNLNDSNLNQNASERDEANDEFSDDEDDQTNEEDEDEDEDEENDEETKSMSASNQEITGAGAGSNSNSTASSMPTSAVTSPAKIPKLKPTIKQKRHVIGPQMSRYLNYRNSLTSSMRGSLMECSVPEDKEEENVGDANENRRQRKKIYNQAASNHSGRNKKYSKNNANSKNHSKQVNVNAKYILERKMDFDQSVNKNHENNATSGFVIPSLMNLRRYISIIDGFSFYNVPFNLESIEFNLRNSLIKKCSDNYRKHHKHISRMHRLAQIQTNQDSAEHKIILFLDYMSYLTSAKLFKNSILLMLSLSFMLSTIGIYVPLIYIAEYTVELKAATHTQGIYILSLIGFVSGLGRILSTIVYKVNHSNAKNRIFSYILTLWFCGFSLLLATFLCDTLFSFSMFAISFGFLIGFNLNLRSLLIYDIVGLEWNDDSLFFNIVLFQSVGVFIGVPIAGLIFDFTQKYSNVFYFSCSCFLVSGLILTPGRKIREYATSSFKSLNKYYLLKRF